MKGKLKIYIKNHPKLITILWLIIILSYVNFSGILKALFGSSLMLNPVFTIILICFSFLLSKGPGAHKIIKYTSIFFIIYLIFGFLGLQKWPHDLWRYPIKLFSSLIIIPAFLYRLKGEISKKKIQSVMVFIMLISSAFTIIQYFFYDFFKPICMAIANRPSGFWINPNLGGFVLYLTYVLTLDMELSKKWIIKLARFLCLIAILLTFSRTIYIVTLFTLIGFVVLKNNKNYWKSSIVLFFSVIIGFGSLYPTFNENQKNRLLSFFDAASGNEIKVNTRKYVWNSSYKHIKKNGPIIGTGHSSMNRVVPYETKGLGPHNFYLWIWGNSGIIGLISFLGLIFGIQFKLARAWFKTKDFRPLMFAFSFCFFAIFEHAFPFDHTIGLLIGLALIVFDEFKISKNLV